MTDTAAVAQLSAGETRLLELVAKSKKGVIGEDVFDAARHLLAAARSEIDTITQTGEGVVVRMALPPPPADWEYTQDGKLGRRPGIQVEYIVAPADLPDADGVVGLQLITPLRQSPMHIYRHRNAALAQFYVDAEPIISQVAQAARELQILCDRATAAKAFGPAGPGPIFSMLEEIAQWRDSTFVRLVELAKASA